MSEKSADVVIVGGGVIGKLNSILPVKARYKADSPRKR